MAHTRRARRSPVLRVAALEVRAVPAALTVPLDPDLDQVGRQVMTIQEFRGAAGTEPRTSFYGIFDTGSPTITWSNWDQWDFEDYGPGGLPLKAGAPLATMQAVGGPIAGHVVEPGQIVADGFHAMQMRLVEEDEYYSLYEWYPAYTTHAAPTGVQSLLGDYDLSIDLPTLTGTPILAPSARHPGGAAALIEMRGEQLDYRDFDGLDFGGDPYEEDPADWVVTFPDLHFVGPNRELADTTTSTAPVYVPVRLFGTDNTTDPGDGLTQAPVPVVVGASAGEGAAAAGGLKLLFDTGAQVTLISSATAQALGIDLTRPPETSAMLWGAGGNVDAVPGYTLDRLELPLSDGGTLTFTNVPVFVYDAAGGTGAVPTALDGILGMNLFNTADTILYDPYRAGGPAVGLTFFEGPRPVEVMPWEADPTFAYMDYFGGFWAPVFSFAGGEADFGPGSVSGIAYNDADRDGRRDAGETGRAGATVYLDVNRNRRLDAADVRTVTAEDGSYRFDGLAAGKYQVRVAPAAGTKQTSRPVAFKVTVTDGTDVVGRNFGIADLPARVARVVVNGGAAQRDAVTGLTVVFSETVSIDPAAFRVVTRTGAAVAFTVTVAEVNGHTEATLTFSQPLANGRYTLAVRGALVTDAAGQVLDGNRDGRPGGAFAAGFHRLAGDWNGDGRVDYFDRLAGGA